MFGLTETPKNGGLFMIIVLSFLIFSSRFPKQIPEGAPADLTPFADLPSDQWSPGTGESSCESTLVLSCALFRNASNYQLFVFFLGVCFSSCLLDASNLPPPKKKKKNDKQQKQTTQQRKKTKKKQTATPQKLIKSKQQQ